jgi:hypothetical protein
MRQSLISWREHRYLKLALVLGLISIGLYVSQGFQQSQPANGGTWQGYILGTVGVGLIVWLSFLGVRKRRYASTMGTVQGWTSAHVYLGTVLLLIGTLHCAAQFGWNVHTLAYVLMCMVIFSGFYGLYAYMHLPGQIAANSGELTRDCWLSELSDLDGEITELAARCDAILQGKVLGALELTRVGGSVLQQLSAIDHSKVLMPPDKGGTVGKIVPNRDQNVIINTLSERIPNAGKQAEAEVLNQLLSLFGRRQFVLTTLRRDVQLKGLVKFWLFLHIPLTAALLVALFIHVLSVFIYW